MFYGKSNTMFSFFKKDPVEKLTRQYKKLMEEARDVQRSGDLKLYAKKMEEAEALSKEISKLKSENNQ